MSIKGILFDFDGTLINTTPAIIASYHATLNDLGHTDASDEEIIETFGLPLEDGLSRFSDYDINKLLAYYREHNWKHHDELAKPFPGTKEALSKLREMGMKMIIVTSKKRYMAEHGIEFLGLQEFFPEIITCDECAKHKPSPEPMLVGAKALGLKPWECLCVGDSPYDILSGEAAGCVTVAVNWTPYTIEKVQSLSRPDYCIEELRELCDIIKSKEDEK